MNTSPTISGSSEGDSIKIFLRVRPPDPSISENDFAPKVLDVNTVDKAIILRTKPEPKVFTYDNVGDADITQEAVFSIVGKKIIESCTAGYNGTIFAYGQTGSGKTFTMLGPSENADSFQHELRGVIPRSFEYLFSIIARQQEMSDSQRQFLCRCSFLEIYQEQIFDLLDPTSQGLHLRENMNKGVFVDGLIEQVICSPSDAYQVLIMGWLNRRVAATSMNRESSRSHAVFTVTIESKEEAHGVQNIRTSCLNLVDLAGSERQKDTNTGGTRLKEAGSINRSLSVLGNVIMSLVDLSHGKKRHIPYRDSKLTFLLRDSLGGNTKTHVVACVHPDSKCFGETLSTLNFARSAKLIKNKAVVNEDIQGNNLKLQNEIRRLKELLESIQNAPMTSDKSMNDSASTNKVTLKADSVWKRCFIEAMYFREISENEKKALQDVVNHLQELCNKKDKYIQSTKMIIKFRENTIQNLQKQTPSHSSESENTETVKSLKEEIRVVRQQLECNPQLAKYSGENKHLRNELKQLRARNSLDDVLSDAHRIAELERVFKELKLFKETEASSSLGNFLVSPLKEGLLAAATENHRQEVKSYQKEIELLKQKQQDIAKITESRQMEMEVELISCRKMISELERVLEAHQLKARIECNVLKDLHCQTLKVMTNPKMSNRKDLSCQSNQTLTPNQEEEGIANCSLPQELIEGAHNALMEEIRTLTVENGKLHQKIDENEAEMLRLKQHLDKKDLYNNQLVLLLEKERNEFSTRSSDYTAAINALKEEMVTVTRDLKLLNEENTDLHLVLKSADKQLKEEKENHKTFQQVSKHEKQRIETQLSHKILDLERITKEYEEVLKELGSLKEEIETSHITIMFYENRAQELEKTVTQELKTRDKLEAELETMKTAEDVAALQRSLDDMMEAAKADIDSKQLELDTLKTQLVRKDQIIAEDKDIVSNLMRNMQDMKAKLSESEASCAALKMESANYGQELDDIKKDLDARSAEVDSLQAELKKRIENFQLNLQKKNLEISNLQEEQESANDSILVLEESLDSKQSQIEAKNLRMVELQSAIEDIKSKFAEKEKSLHMTIAWYEQRQTEMASTGTGTVENVDSFKKLLSQKNIDMESLRSDTTKLRASLEEYEHARRLKNEETEHLKARLKELEFKNAELLKRNDNENMQLSFVPYKPMIHEKTDSMLKRDIESETEITRLKTQLEELHKAKNELHSSMDGLAEEKSPKLPNEFQGSPEALSCLISPSRGETRLLTLSDKKSKDQHLHSRALRKDHGKYVAMVKDDLHSSASQKSESRTSDGLGKE